MFWKKTGVTLRSGLLCALLLVGLTGCEQEIVTEIGDSLTPKEETRVVLTMGIEDGEVFYLGESGCSKEEFMLYLTNMQNSYEEIYGEGLWDVSEDGGSMERRIKDNVAARIAQVKTMALLAEDYQVSLTEDEERLVQQASLEYFRSLNKNELDALSVTQETVAGIYRENLLAHNVYTYIIKDVNPEISDDEARNVEAAWVFVGGDEEDDEAKSLAINVKALADQGNDFDELITTYSDDKDLTHTFGKGQVDPAVEEAAFSLAEGQISGVITGADGYYVIKCLTTLDRKETDANKEKIVAKRKQEAFNDVYKNFAENLMQRLNEEAWEEIKMIHDPAVSTSSLFAVYDKYFPEE